MSEMKTLTVNGKKFYVVDEAARKKTTAIPVDGQEFAQLIGDNQLIVGSLYWLTQGAEEVGLNDDDIVLATGTNTYVALEQIDGERTLTSDDFVRGLYTYQQGIVSNDYYIVNEEPIYVAEGEKIYLKPNKGVKINYTIRPDSDLTSSGAHISQVSNITTETEVVAPKEGYLLVHFYNGGYYAHPENLADYGEVRIGSSRLGKLEREVEAVKESVNKYSIAISPKHRGFTNIVNDCQDVDDWTITNTTADLVNADTTNYIMGSQSIRCDGSMTCKKHTYNLLENYLVLKIRLNSLANNARLYVTLSSTTNPSYSCTYYIALGNSTADYHELDEWIEYTIPHTAYAWGGFENMDFSAIDTITVHASEGVVDWNLQFIGTRPIRSKKGVVTFTFDDGFKSQATGIRLLAERGITSTLFHIPDASTTNPDEYLTVSELQNLVNLYGADIEAHHGVKYADMTDEELISHWTATQTFLKENGLSEGKHLAYPNGSHPTRVVQLAKRFFESARTIEGYGILETYPPSDNFRMRAVSSVGSSGFPVDTVKSYIDKAVAGGGWLILVFHRIEAGEGSMYCSESDLQAIADYAVDSGASIMNMAEVFDSNILE